MLGPRCEEYIAASPGKDICSLLLELF